jgi:hypothetical protein
MSCSRLNKREFYDTEDYLNFVKLVISKCFLNINKSSKSLWPRVFLSNILIGLVLLVGSPNCLNSYAKHFQVSFRLSSNAEFRSSRNISGHQVKRRLFTSYDVLFKIQRNLKFMIWNMLQFCKTCNS